MDKVGFLTLGCKVNQYETQAMSELFKKSGYEISNDDNCDIYVINTCTVTNLSDRKSRQQISKVKKLNPKAIIAVVGCYSQVKSNEIEEIEDVDVILGTKNRNDIVSLCEKAKKYNIRINEVSSLTSKESFEDMTIEQQDHMTRAYIKVQEGCNQYCSYCIIPYARGPVRSRDISSIYDEALKLAKHGYKEIILTGIHVASYGLDFKNDTSIIDVIEKIAEIKELKRIRMSSVEPRLITKDFLERLRNTGKSCDHFHLSLQSGSDEILQRMNRRYNCDLYMDKVKLIREYFPNAGLTTDIIVGFPGETDDHFKETLDFIQKVRFNKIHVFKYSPRVGTKAASMDHQVPGEIKKKRSQILIDLSDKITDTILDKYIGKDVFVLFESKNENGMMAGYTSNYIRVRKSYDIQDANKLVSVRISQREKECLIAD